MKGDTMKKQLGVSLSGLLIFSVVLIFVALLGFKLFKPYTEYFAIQKIFRTIATKPEVRNGTRRDFKHGEPIGLRIDPHGLLSL